MSEDAESKSNAGRWVIAVVVALVLYVLSWGPVWALVTKYYPTDTAFKMIDNFYMPLSFSCERLGADKFMHNYIIWSCKVFHVYPF